jgi:DNA-binding CsgD family transcriptional regulator
MEQVPRPPVTRAISPPTQAVPIERLEQTVNLLLSPAQHESRSWRQDVLTALRGLVDADRAVMFLGQGAAPAFCGDALPQKVIEEYLADFAPLDHGMARRDALRLTLWTRSLLWERCDLMRSAYYHEFALRHDILDTVGVSLDFEGTAAHLRVVLLYGEAPLPPDRVEMMLWRLGLIVPVLRAGFGMHLRFERWLGAIPSMLDQIGERLVLYSLAGRELHRNITMRRTLEQDSERDRIIQRVQDVAQAVITQANSREITSRLAARDPLRQEVQTALGRYRLRGCMVGPDTVDAESAVLVSVDRLDHKPPTAEVLQAQFGLTTREVQVTALLVQRLTNEEIADALGISTHTARHHTESVLLKVGVNSRRMLRRTLIGDQPA